MKKKGCCLISIIKNKARMEVSSVRTATPIKIQDPLFSSQTLANLNIRNPLTEEMVPRRREPTISWHYTL